METQLFSSFKHSVSMRPYLILGKGIYNLDHVCSRQSLFMRFAILALKQLNKESYELTIINTPG